MKTSFPGFFVFALLVLFVSGCQSPGFGDSPNVWRRPEYFGGPKKSVAVAVLAYRKDTRIRLETALVSALRQHGVNARTTYGSIETQTIVSNKPLAIEHAKSLGVEAVLAVRMVDRQTLKIVQFSPSNSGQGLPPWQNWFEFFTVSSAFATNPEMAQPGSTIGAQAAFFECPSGDLLWSATFPQKIGDSSQVETFAKALANKLSGAALIP